MESEGGWRRGRMNKGKDEVKENGGGGGWSEER